jgi:hypothetical protein
MRALDKVGGVVCGGDIRRRNNLVTLLRFHTPKTPLAREFTTLETQIYRLHKFVEMGAEDAAEPEYGRLMAELKRVNGALGTALMREIEIPRLPQISSQCAVGVAR